jgi:hypothetical protein
VDIAVRTRCDRSPGRVVDQRIRLAHSTGLRRVRASAVARCRPASSESTAPRRGWTAHAGRGSRARSIAPCETLAAIHCRATRLSPAEDRHLTRFTAHRIRPPRRPRESREPNLTPSRKPKTGIDPLDAKPPTFQMLPNAVCLGHDVLALAAERRRLRCRSL